MIPNLCKTKVLKRSLTRNNQQPRLPKQLQNVRSIHSAITLRAPVVKKADDLGGESVVTGTVKTWAKKVGVSPAHSIF
jgi:hypothetical protein